MIAPELGAAAEAGARAAIRNSRPPPKIPGVVTAIDTHIRVKLNGDTGSIAVSNASGQTVTVGQKVMVELRPGLAVFIT